MELRAWLERRAPGDRPAAVVEWVCDWICRPDFNGCASVRSHAELHDDADVLAKARRRKHQLRETIEHACRAAEMADAIALSEELTLVVEGATTTAYITGDGPRAAAAARRVGRAVLAVAADESA